MERDLTEYNISAHFIFEVSHTTALFPLMGINYSREKETIGSMVSSEEAFGLNLGGGEHWVWAGFYLMSNTNTVSVIWPNMYSVSGPYSS